LVNFAVVELRGTRAHGLQASPMGTVME
jgi:hypothetical protein